MTGRTVLAVAAVLVLAGCAAPIAGPGRPDPAVDRLGWESGYWYDDPLQVTTADGLNGSERSAVVARTMARVEEIRRLEFTRSVAVEVISREQYLDRRGNGTGGGGGAYERWNNQVWEALLLVGERRNVSQVFSSTLSTTVQGYYSSGDIVVVSDSPTPSIDRGTLAHELVHALQAQHYSLGGNPQFQDAQLAHDGVVEGDANYVQRLYERRCGSRWDCLPRPERGGGGGGGSFNRGVFLTIFTPYAAGPTFVESVRRQPGWRRVNALYGRFPASTEQLIHPELYPDERPVDVSVRDRSNARWNRFDLNRPVYDRVGEASIYAMFWANGAVDRENRSPYQYDHPLSAGWGGDRLVPYRDGDRFGYVWVTAWDTRRDARQFVGAYREILANRSVRQPRAGVYVLPESDPFGDAFRVTRRGRRVRIVNGPTVQSLDGIHGGR